MPQRACGDAVSMNGCAIGFRPVILSRSRIYDHRSGRWAIFLLLPVSSRALLRRRARPQRRSGSARPEGGASAFASAMPGTNLSSKMQGVEDKFADQATKTGTSLDEHAESLLAAERDFIAAEEENGQLIGSILQGHS